MAPWKDLLLKNDSHDPRPVLANALIALRHAPELRQIVKYDAFACREMWFRSPGLATSKPRQLLDSDFTKVSEWLQHNGLPTVASGIVREAVLCIARENSYNTLVDELNSISWDGIPRLDNWLTTYAGVDPSEYASLAGRYWLISAAARALTPGCQVDHILTLEGGQGSGKSSALRILGGEFFTDALPADITHKDASSALRGAWIVEIAELRATRRAGADAIKDYLSRRIERFRPSHGRLEVTEPRTCVFAGTVNPDGAGYLKDTTGNRRWWPVKCGKFDLKGLERDRDQLIAEAVAEFRMGTEWWPSNGEKSLFGEQQSARTAVDPWESILAESLRGKANVTANDAAHFLDIQANRLGVAEARRIGNVLISLGFCRGKLDSKTRRQMFSREGCEGFPKDISAPILRPQATVFNNFSL